MAHKVHKDAGTALLVVDMIADYEFENGDRVFNNALPAAQSIAKLKERAKAARIPVIYVNDNYGVWRNNFEATLAAAERSERGKQIVGLLRPDKDDYHVLKPQRSGFFATPLDILLKSLDVSTLIITGVSADICVLFTAHDAYMRGYTIKVPNDCTAAADKAICSEAIEMLKRVADADVKPSHEIEFAMVEQASS
jgi:nicotinamidase-related amidase